MAESQRGLFSRVLEPALNLWLRSQVESVDTLSIQIASGDRQILRGQIEQVQLQAETAVYRGLHLSRIKLSGQTIKLNFRQIFQGKPIQLLEPIPVYIDTQIDADHAQASLASSLLQQTILNLLFQLVPEQIAAAFDADDLTPDSLALEALTLTLEPDRLRLHTQLRSPQTHQTVPVTLRTGLTLAQPNCLALEQPEWLPTPNARRGLALKELQGYRFDLGPLAHLDQVSITCDRIHLSGDLTVMPALEA